MYIEITLKTKNLVFNVNRKYIKTKNLVFNLNRNYIKNKESGIQCK